MSTAIKNDLNACFNLINLSKIIMENSLSELFPELKTKLDPSVYCPSFADFENNAYFADLV
jgi:hypothetical protein